MSIRRNIGILLLATAFAVGAIPACAQGNGNGQGNGQGQGGGSQGQGEGQGQGQGGGQGQGQGAGGGQGGAPGNGPGNGRGGGNEILSSDEDFALEAVRTRRALPLADILATAGPSVASELIDARLVTIRGFLVYEVKSMTGDGRVSLSYYYARSGRKVGSD